MTLVRVLTARQNILPNLTVSDCALVDFALKNLSDYDVKIGSFGFSIRCHDTQIHDSLVGAEPAGPQFSSAARSRMWATRSVSG